MENNKETYNIQWNEILIRITYEPDWVMESRCGVSMSHLEIMSIDPEKAPLPMTETGYRSYFSPPNLIDAEGGPVAIVIKQLNLMAQSKVWKDVEETSRQLDLFS